MKKLNAILRLKRPRIGVAGKHLRLTHAVPIGLLLLPVIWFIVSPHHIFADLMSSPGLTVTVTEPNGVGDKFKEETDFATVVLGDPWDMNQSTDIKVNGPVDNPGRGFGGASFASGVFSGTTISNDAYFWLLHQGYPQANNVDPHSGLVNPIDASKYTRLTFRLYRDDGNTNVPVRVYWYKAGDEVTGQPSGTSVGLTPYAGWHVYSLDLSNPANASTGSWSGQITGIRIDPTSTSDATFSGKLVQLDWARLTDPTSGTTYNVTWTSNLSSGSALASVFLDDDNNFNNGTLATIGASILVTNTTGAYAWKPQGMPPGNYYVHVSMGTDYAGVVRGDPWDFNQSTDYVATYNLSNVVTAGGIFSGTSTSNDPQIWMNVDATNPISTSLFHTLVISINVSSRVDFMVLWTRQGDPGPWQGQSKFVSIDPGWRAVSIELSNPNNIALGSWSGSATDFRVDPGTVSGVTYQIAWVGVTSGVTPTLESDLSPALGTSTGPLTVNQAPIATFIAPSMTSGDDYATTVLAAPWNPGLSSTFVRTDELTNTIYAGNILTATSVSGLHVGCGVGDCGDPELWLNVSPDPSRFIDAARFKYITLKYWNEIEQDVFGGSVLRFLWTPTIFPNDISTIDDVVVRDGWPSYTAADGYHTYQFNLQNLLMEPEGGVCTVANCWGWNDSHGRISQLRFDPIEVPYGSTFHVQQILLTADPVASGSYTISWSLQNTDDTATVSAYYYTNPLSKTLIGSAQQPTSTLVWNTTPLPSATYTVELQVNDGYNTTIWPSQAPLIVRPSPVITLTKPTGSDQVTR
ncbi:MAG: hypothetical protein HYR71_09245, partial [Chloroflexi bacterium]|nr:hypothetical protein [Chloroflexota bacterium]